MYIISWTTIIFIVGHDYIDGDLFLYSSSTFETDKLSEIECYERIFKISEAMQH